MRDKPATTSETDQPAIVRPRDVEVVGTHPVAPTGLEPAVAEASLRVRAPYAPKRGLGNRAKLAGAVVLAALLAAGATTDVVSQIDHERKAASKRKAAGAAAARQLVASRGSADGRRPPLRELRAAAP